MVPSYTVELKNEGGFRARLFVEGKILYFIDKEGCVSEIHVFLQREGSEPFVGILTSETKVNSLIGALAEIGCKEEWKNARGEEIEPPIALRWTPEADAPVSKRLYHWFP